jgi:hypothetical protein
MRRLVRVLAAVATGAALSAGVQGSARADLTLEVAGSDLKGERMQGSCTLRPLSPPSNTFTGRCELTLGGEPLTVSGLDFNGEAALSAVLDGRLTIRGRAESAGKRFADLASDGKAGFPLYLHIDPFGRAWKLERDVPGGSREPVAGGAISAGKVGLDLQ